MRKIGISLGADVPASISNKPVLVKGIGEVSEEINSKSKYYIVLIKPYFSCNTKKMYEKLDSIGTFKQKYNTKDMIEALKENNIDGISNNLYNAFENTVYGIEQMKKNFLDVNAKRKLNVWKWI